MAQNKTAPAAPVGRGAPRKSRVSVIPLSVLLPTMGEVGALYRLQPLLERRLQSLQNEAVSYEEEGEDGARVVVEESMLNQALQWLSVSNTEE